MVLFHSSLTCQNYMSNYMTSKLLHVFDMSKTAVIERDRHVSETTGMQLVLQVYTQI